MLTIRPGVPSDSIEFAVLVKQFVREAKYPFKVDIDLVVGNFKAGVVDPKFFFHVVEEEDTLVGFLAGAINTTLFSNDVTGIELGWYLQPESRDGRTALKLLKAFEEWCVDKGCRHISIADIDTLQSLAPLYERKGYRLTEKTYVKEL